MTDREQQEQKKRNYDQHTKYYGGNDIDVAIRNQKRAKKEIVYEVSQEELERMNVPDECVLVRVDALDHIDCGEFSLVLPEEFGNNQFNTMHQSVSGIVTKDSGAIKSGWRVFMHYLTIINARLQMSNSGVFIKVGEVAYVVVFKRDLFVGVVEGVPVAMNPDFCITEAVPRENSEIIEGAGGTKFIISKSNGLVADAEADLNAWPYDPFKCRIVSMPSDEGATDKQIEAMSLIDPASTGTGILGTQRIKAGDIVRCRKSWNLKIDNGMQKYLGNRLLFRTRITAIQEKISQMEAIVKTVGYDRILVKELLAEDTQSGGVIITQDESEAPARGEVVAVSEDISSSLKFKVGDVVLFARRDVQPVPLKDEVYLLLKSKDVYCII